MEGPTPVLAAHEVSFRIGGRLVLDRVSLTLGLGELVAVVGPNGAGKTTLIRALGGAIKPSGGQVSLDGADVRRWGRRALAQTVATVPQLPELSFDLTALELALLGRHPHLARFQLEGRRDLEVAMGALTTTGADTFSQRSVLTLSGGERQLVYLARGLSQEPGVLLVDEPTANLDLVHQLQIMELLHRLAKDHGLAVLAALHDVNLAARYADRLVLLAGGRVVAEGSPEDVLTSERLEMGFGVRAVVDQDRATGALSVTALEPSLPAGSGGRGLDAEGGDAPLEDLSQEGRARKRAEQAAMRRHPNRRAQGLVLVNTGEGKGKTTAALGLLLRAWGRDLHVVMFQFIKARTANWGENRAAARLGVEIIPLGEGFTWVSRDIERDRMLAQEGWRRAREGIEGGRYDIVILDELTYLFKFGWLDVQEVVEVLRRRPEGQHVVITGRDAPAELIEFADLVTDMREVKHPYRSGVKAQPGIEF